MLGLDLGTMNIVSARLDSIDDSDVIFERERNIFAECRDSLEDPEQILKDNNYSYINHEGKFYVIGEDVFKINEIESLFRKTGAQKSYFSSIKRPMKNGLLNTAEEKMSLAIIREIISKVVGKPKSKDELITFCSPGDPINSSNSTTFHKSMLTSIIRQLGFSVDCINEAVSIIYSEAPYIEDSSELGGKAKFSGMAISCGAGMINCAFVYKQLPLLTFSIEGSGDFIDFEAAKVCGLEPSSITRFKERSFDLSKIDYSDIRQSSLDVFYGSVIENIVQSFSVRFEKLGATDKISAPMDVVLAGGTCMVPGFLEKFKNIIGAMNLPFNVKEVKLASNPLFCVANGCLIRSISLSKKLQK